MTILSQLTLVTAQWEKSTLAVNYLDVKLFSASRTFISVSFFSQTLILVLSYWDQRPIRTSLSIFWKLKQLFISKCCFAKVCRRVLRFLSDATARANKNNSQTLCTVLFMARSQMFPSFSLKIGRIYGDWKLWLVLAALKMHRTLIWIIKI